MEQGADNPPVTRRHFFISYARDDGISRDRAATLERHFNDLGVPVFRDVTSLTAGRPWKEELAERVRESWGLLLVVTPDARESEWVRKELETADSAGIDVIPVKVRDMEPWPPYHLITYIDFTSSAADPLRKLVDVINHFYPGPDIGLSIHRFIKIAVSNNGTVDWAGPYSPEYVAELWGDPIGHAHPEPIQMLVDGTPSRELTAAVLRLAFHGGVVELYSRATGDWETRCDGLVRCLGVDDDGWRSTSEPGHPTRWKLLPYAHHTLGKPIRDYDLPGAAADTLARQMEASMDEWVWQRLCHILSEKLSGRHKLLGSFVPEEIQERMESLWAGWQATLDADPAFRTQWLQSMLSVAESPARSQRTARARLGPRTVEHALVEAVAFALVVEVGLAPEARCAPTAEPFPVNLSFFANHAHLLGLALHEGEELDAGGYRLDGDPPFRLMRHHSGDFETIEAEFTRVGRGPTARVGSRDIPLVFTCPPALKRAIRDGLTPLQDYFAELRHRVSARYRETYGETG